ncbi:hypothetical protein [Massilia niabensis]|uniref:HNH endonuclease n=1 Tax=Massilia niabensis TaxID=544910 RepID=A0ABW0L1G6_9BURK
MALKAKLLEAFPAQAKSDVKEKGVSMECNDSFKTVSTGNAPHTPDEMRVNFLNTTKRVMRERAGSLCSYRKCLRATLLPIMKKDTTSGSARIGDAAHIYGASANGPRRELPPGYDVSKLSDVENGVWMCCHHARQIDRAEIEHTAEELTDMKRVREFAQQRIVTDSFLHSFAPYVPAMVLDEVVWEHLPALDVGVVRQAMINACYPYFPGSDALLGRTMPDPPSHFILTPVARVVKKVAEDAPLPEAAEVARIDLSLHERNRAFQIVDGWAQLMPRATRNDDLHLVSSCYVKLAARNPGTGEIDDAFIWTKATYASVRRVSVANNKQLTIRVSSSRKRVSDLDWQLNISILNDDYRAESVLKTHGAIAPQDIRDDHEWSQFCAYARVISRLAEGWEPIGFVSQRSNDCNDVRWIHPEPFEIEMRISPEELAELQYRCNKAVLARELSFQWGCRFVFTHDYFDRALTELMIRAASAQLLYQQASPSWPPVNRIGPLVQIQAREVYFSNRSGDIMFDTSPIPRLDRACLTL